MAGGAGAELARRRLNPQRTHRVAKGVVMLQLALNAGELDAVVYFFEEVLGDKGDDTNRGQRVQDFHYISPPSKRPKQYFTDGTANEPRRQYLLDVRHHAIRQL